MKKSRVYYRPRTVRASGDTSRFYRRRKYGAFTTDYLYPALRRGGEALSPMWESTKKAYRRMSPTITRVTSPIMNATRIAGTFSPLVYGAIDATGYSTPTMEMIKRYIDHASSGVGAYDVLAGPAVTGSMMNAGILGLQGALHGGAAMAYMAAGNPMGAAIYGAYALSHGQRAARESYRSFRNRYGCSSKSKYGCSPIPSKGRYGCSSKSKYGCSPVPSNRGPYRKRT